MIFHDLETDRLILRSISEADGDFIFREFSNDDVNKYLYDAEPMTNIGEADEIISFYLQPEPRSQHRWIIILKDGGEPVGTCGFHCLDKEKRSAEIGYDMQKAYWGNGYMTEAVSAALNFAMTKMNLNRLDAHIFADNERSVKLAKRMGFIFEGKMTSYSFRGKDYPHRIYTFYREKSGR